MATYQGGLEQPQGVADDTGPDWFAQNAAQGGAPHYGSGPNGAATVADIQRAAVELLGHPLSDPTPWVGQRDFYQNLQNSEEAQNFAKLKASKATSSTSAKPGSSGDPVRDAVLAAFQKKGIQPRDEQDIQYWIDHIKNSKGGWDDPGNQKYWLDRMDQEQGGVGDYQERPEQGAPGTPGNQEFSYPAFGETFTAPSGLTEENDPGFQARMKLGADALQRSAAAKGSVLDTGTLKDLNTYAQNFASNEYAQVYNRAADTYNQHLQKYNQGFQNALSTFGTNFGVDQSLWQRALTESNTGFQRYLSLADLGLAGVGGTAGSGSTFGNQAGTGYTGIGNAGAAGTVAGSNALAKSLGELANYGSQYWYGNRGNRTGNGYGVGMGTPGF